MIENYFTKNVVACDVDAQTPEEVIRSVGNLLVQANKVDDSYVDAALLKKIQSLFRHWVHILYWLLVLHFLMQNQDLM